ncbi:hypothetical protein IWX49DRAFT_553806 [Phyllosticta citricarpa]|uniref:Anaphase-promoting complex subunit CDC26 n=2 Tax=Phyllosticta TaxID=121621 RepID=A0ABR1MMW7_9PEZI
MLRRAPTVITLTQKDIQEYDQDKEKRSWKQQQQRQQEAHENTRDPNNSYMTDPALSQSQSYSQSQLAGPSQHDLKEEAAARAREQRQRTRDERIMGTSGRT